MGMGVDVHGGDYTKAARRAVSDALRHSSLNFFEAAGKTRDDMHVEVVIAVADPDAVDTAAIAAEVAEMTEAAVGTTEEEAMTGDAAVHREIETVTAIETVTVTAIAIAAVTKVKTSPVH